MMAEQEQVSTAPSEPTLDDVYKQFNVEEVAKSFEATPQKQPEFRQETPVNVPDPTLDTDGFQRWARQVHSADSEIKQTLHRVSEQLNTFQQERQRQQEEADIKNAVQKLKEKVDADEDFLEIALAHKARKDPKLLAVWENRHKNEKAWEAALKAVGNEFAGKFSMRADPQLAENTRAMKASRDQMATTQKESPDDKWAAMDEGEFQQEWSRLVGGAQ
jgi:hypothetical protein